jgi:hypothetical protein
MNSWWYWGRPSGVLRTTTWKPAEKPEPLSPEFTPPDGAMTPEYAVEVAVARGWKQQAPAAGQYQWRGPDGELSPTWSDWNDARQWICERMRELTDPPVT